MPTRSAERVKPSNMAIRPDVADRVRAAARKSPLSIIDFTTALLEDALERAPEMDAHVQIRWGKPAGEEKPKPKRKR